MAVDDLRSGTWVTYVGGRASGVRIRRVRLDVLTGPDKGLTRDFEDPVLRIGARKGSDLVLADSKVSGIHCEIRLDERGYRLRDMDSTNGTHVGGYRINDIYISPGTVIHIGSTKIRFNPLGDSVEVPLSAVETLGGIVGQSVLIREMFARLEKVAQADATVLITGETGTGKELVAEAIHEHSKRKDGPFVVLDCGAIPQNLIESELFGHERGAFTGATHTYAGAFERADGGTVFLDEIGELPLGMQPKMLRVLERKEVRRIGGSKVTSTDIRVVAATNRDLGVEVNRGRFREDLYYRLAVARIHVPPLRERREDIPLLIEHFMSITPGGEGTSLDPGTVELMMKHDWPGNVRELRNVIERAVLLSDHTSGGIRLSKTAIGGRMSPSRYRSPSSSDATPSSTTGDTLAVIVDTSTPFKLAKQALVEEFERRYIGRLLEQHDGNISAAARAAGIDRMSIHKMLHRLGIENLRGKGNQT